MDTKNSIISIALAICLISLSISCSVPKRTQLVPEYSKTGSVVVSEFLFAKESTKGLELANAILEADANLVILRNAPTTRDEKIGWLHSMGFKQDDLSRIEVLEVAHDSYWIRDFGPVPLVERHKGLPDRLKFMDFVYRDESYIDDTVPYQMGIYFRASIESIPFNLDGGNFLVDARNCYVTSEFVQKVEIGTEIKVTDNQPIEVLERNLKSVAGCKKVIVLHDAPHEHIDMFMKVINHNNMIVHEIPDQVSVDPEGALTRFQMRNAQNHLKKYAKITPIPMAPPYKNLFRSYTNALIVNKTVIMPKYEVDALTQSEYPDKKILMKYEAIAKQTYEKFGYKVAMINADQLISKGGALHCVAVQLPNILQ